MADEQEFRVPLVWEGLDEVPILFANNFLIQHQPDEFVMTVSQVTAPPVLGTPEEQREQITKITEVPVRVLGRYALTRRRLVELIALLQENLANHDRTMEALGGGSDDHD